MNPLGTSRRANDDLLTGSNLRLRIGEHVVDTGALRVVTRPELPRLTSKSVAVLIELVREVGQTVTRDQLLDRVWTGRFPTPDVLTQAIKELRRALADDRKPPQIIETIPKVGYRLIAPVLVLDGPDPGLAVDNAHAARAVAAESEIATQHRPGEKTHARVETRRLPWLVAGGALIAFAAAAIAVAIVRWQDGAPATSNAGAWKVVDSRALTSDPGAERRPRLSPDGTRIAFGITDATHGVNRVVVRSIEPSQVVRISSGGDEQEALPVWSPDGTRIVFARVRESACTLFVASSLGGDEREIGGCRDANANAYDWMPDGHGLITAQSAKGDGGDLALVTLDIDSGARTFLTYQRTDADQDLDPHYSPDGKSIAFRRGVAPYSDLYVMPATGGAPRQITHIASRIRGHAWTRDGRALIFASNFAGAMSLYCVDVASGVVQPLGVSPAEYPATAHDSDSVTYEIPRTHNQLERIDLIGDKSARTLVASTGSDYAPALSPGGDRLAFVSDRSGQYQVWLYDPATDIATPLTDNPDSPVFWPRWSTDGKRIIAVELNPTAGRRLIEVDVASRRQRVLSSAGETILFGADAGEPDTYLVAKDVEGGSNQLLLVRHPGAPEETRETVASGIVFAQVDAAQRAIYYTPAAGDGLYRYALDGGARTFVSDKVTAAMTNGWRVVDGHIWYLTGFDVKPIVLHALDPSTGDERVVTRIDTALRDVNFSVMPDRSALILSQIGSEDTDIGMFTLTRADAP